MLYDYQDTFKCNIKLVLIHTLHLTLYIPEQAKNLKGCETSRENVKYFENK